MKLSIIVPVYNEKENILKVLDKVRVSDTLQLAKEIIIIDDFSNDGTKDILSSLNDSSIKITRERVLQSGLALGILLEK
jgi:glycosyltransferase involved in cell wall biosynthesis